MSRAVASLGDAALLVPAWLLLSLALLAARRVRPAILWSAAIVLCAGATVLAKLVFHACGPSLSDLDVVSPSGHASLASVFYGGLALMIGVGRPVAWRAALATGSVVLLALIGASRVRTGAHSAEEVAIGFGIGGLALALLALAYRRSAPETVPAWPLAACLAVAVLALGGRHFSLERTIGRTARELASAIDVCTPTTVPAPSSRRLSIDRSALP